MKTKVLFLIPTLGGGGAERVIVTLLRHLDRAKFDLTLGVVDGRLSRFKDELPADVRYIDFGCARVRYALPRLIRIIRQDRPQIVFSTLGHLNLAIALLRPLLPSKTKFIARETSIVSKGILRHRWPRVWQWGYRHLYRNIDTIVCQSIYMKEDLAAHFGVPRDKMVVINNPVDVARVRSLASAPSPFPSDENFSNVIERRIQFVAAGRLTPEKGFDLLIEAFALCIEGSGSKRNIFLTVLGEGRLEGELKKLSRDRGVADLVGFAGFVANPFKYFAHADAFLLSSRYEGFPNVVLEALACGTPIVALPSPGGLGEILQNVHGSIIADELSAKALAVAMMQWIRGNRERPSPSVAAPYGLPIIIDKYEEMLIKHESI